MIVIDFPFLPPEELRGNSKLHPKHRTRHKKILRESGKDNGMVVMMLNPDVEFPLEGDLAVHIDAYTKRHKDGDNLLYGYKSFLDALQVRMSGTREPGCGMIQDDKQFKMYSIRVHKGEERSVITIRRDEPE